MCRRHRTHPGSRPSRCHPPALPAARDNSYSSARPTPIPTGRSPKHRSSEEGHVYRGMEPNRLSARITPHGGGLLVGHDPTGPTGKQTVVLARDPGGRFHTLPEPPAGVLLSCSEAANRAKAKQTPRCSPKRKDRGRRRCGGREREPHRSVFRRARTHARSRRRTLGRRTLDARARRTARRLHRRLSRSWRSPAPRQRICGC